MITELTFNRTLLYLGDNILLAGNSCKVPRPGLRARYCFRLFVAAHPAVPFLLHGFVVRHGDKQTIILGTNDHVP